MQRFSKLLLGIGLIVGIGVISVKSADPPVQPYPATAYSLQRKQTVALQLPAGDYLSQAGTDALFMSTVWINGRLPTEVVNFSMLTSAELWRVDLAAPPLQVLDAGESYLIGTAPLNGNGHLVSVSKQEGKLLWDKALGNSSVAVAQYGSRVFAATADGVSQIDLVTGETLARVVIWDKLPSNSDWRTLAVYDHEGVTRIAASAGPEIYTYQETAAGWEQLWQFHSSKTVLELHPVIWQPDNPPDLLALAHSVIYDIQADGGTVWRINNNDINQDAQPVHCQDGESYYAFRNIMNGVYLVNRSGLIRTWEMPGGAAKLGPIPLPISANPPVGLTIADLTADGQDEIIARSVTQLFVFDCQGKLLANTALNEGLGDTLVTQLRNSPRYRPLTVKDQIVVAEKGQIGYFSFTP